MESAHNVEEKLLHVVENTVGFMVVVTTQGVNLLRRYKNFLNLN